MYSIVMNVLYTFVLLLVFVFVPSVAPAQSSYAQTDSVSLRIEAKATITRALDSAYENDYLGATNALEELRSWPRMRAYVPAIDEALTFVQLRHQHHSYAMQCHEGASWAAKHKHRKAIRAFKAAQRYAHTADEHEAVARALRQVRRCRNRCTAIRGTLVAVLLPIDLLLLNVEETNTRYNTAWSDERATYFPMLTALLSPKH